MTAQTDTRGVILTCPTCGQKNRLGFAHLGSAARCGTCKTGIAPLSMPLAVGSAGSFDALVAAATLPVLVDFWAEWCAPCRMVAPELEKVAEANAGRLLVAKVDTEAVPSLSGRFNVRSLPSLAVVNAGRVIARTTGARPWREIERFVSGALQTAR